MWNDTGGCLHELDRGKLLKAEMTSLNPFIQALSAADEYWVC